MTGREGLGLRYKKKEFSNWFNEVLKKAELADLRYSVKGFLVHRPFSVILMKEMYKLYEKELEKREHKPVWFPAVIPESNFKLEGEHVEGFMPEVFWIENAGKKARFEERLALRPTSETAMYKMYAKWIRSWRDLPLKLYQSCQIWRYETKATRPFIRGREFYWIESHDVFATKEEAEKQVKEDMEITENVMHREFCIPFIFIRRTEQDKFPGAVYTFAADTLMPDGKVLQQPSTHLLGQNFSKPFGIKFKNKDGKEEYAWQTCYGPCIWRMVASVIALHGDDKGLVFPFKIAPVQIVIIPIGNEKKVLKKCREIEEKLKDVGLRVEVDDSDKTPGWKFNEWELKGVPIRMEVGPRELERKELTVYRRDTGKRKIIKEKELLKYVEKTGEKITENLRKKADKFFKENIKTARNVKELEKELENGGIIRVNFCSIGREGAGCEER